ncbi:MAG TPA: DNA repair protein [Bacteroidetes bacterium]|nr:DNA repair protein [Bacteroidota bacterium]
MKDIDNNTNASINQAVIRFPGIDLKTRDAHKLRGYFGDIFKEYSTLLHNHYSDGSSRYKYPLVQYKVIDKLPVLTGFGEGADLLIKLFLDINRLNINGQTYEISSKNISNIIVKFDDFSQLHTYEFKTLWMALNQDNYSKYMALKTIEEKNKFLNKILTGNILSFYKGIDVFINEKILIKGKYFERQTHFKNKKMLAFKGEFITNAIIPDFTGVGKSTSRGFGTIFAKKV